MYYELTPAYGRDYKTAAAVKAAFEAGKDFTGDYQLGFALVNKPQIAIGSTVNLRYKGGRNLAVVKVAHHNLTPELVAAEAPKVPSIATMTRWMMNGEAKATDGCIVEPDGTCEHGKPSWLLKMGVI